MRDLVVPPGPGIPKGVVIPAVELSERFSRSSGPGGQSVNTADSRVELIFDVETSTALSPLQRDRVVATLGPRVSIMASEYRSQLRNRTAARDRLVELLRSALAPPPPVRRATKPSRRAQQRRIEAKKQRGSLKSLRGRVGDE